MSRYDIRVLTFILVGITALTWGMVLCAYVAAMWGWPVLFVFPMVITTLVAIGFFGNNWVDK